MFAYLSDVVASISISSCYLIFGNLFTNKGARTILIFLLFWDWFNNYLVYEFPLHSILVFMLKNFDILRGFYKGPQ